MEDSIKVLASIAEELDQKGLTPFADRLDSISSKVLSVKIAQYVGSQGYAIRNSRCWGNCYRQKRLSNPKMAAQEVWTECHKEYVESINNDGSSWDKYAEGSSNFIKTASDKSYFSMIDKTISNKINEKISSGLDVGTSIFSSLDEVYNQGTDLIIKSSSDLLDVASDLVFDVETSKKISYVAEQLIKEAGPFDFFKGVGKSVSNWTGDMSFKGKLESIIAKINKSINEFERSYSEVGENYNGLKNILQQSKSSFESVVNDPNSTPKQKQYAQSALQSLGQALSAPKNMNSFRSVLPKVIESLKSVARGNVFPANTQQSPVSTGGVPPQQSQGSPLPMGGSNNVLNNTQSNLPPGVVGGSGPLFNQTTTPIPNSQFNQRITQPPNKAKMRFP